MAVLLGNSDSKKGKCMRIFYLTYNSCWLALCDCPTPHRPMATASSSARQHERKQIKQAYDGAKAGSLFRSPFDKISDPVSRRSLGLKIAGGVRIDVFVRARPPSDAEVEAGEAVVVKVNPTKCTVGMK
jgi:hypothetical protein